MRRILLGDGHSSQILSDKVLSDQNSRTNFRSQLNQYSKNSKFGEIKRNSLSFITSQSYKVNTEPGPTSATTVMKNNNQRSSPVSGEDDHSSDELYDPPIRPIKKKPKKNRHYKGSFYQLHHQAHSFSIKNSFKPKRHSYVNYLAPHITKEEEEQLEDQIKHLMVNEKMAFHQKHNISLLESGYSELFDSAEQPELQVNHSFVRQDKPLNSMLNRTQNYNIPSKYESAEFINFDNLKKKIESHNLKRAGGLKSTATNQRNTPNFFMQHRSSMNEQSGRPDLTESLVSTQLLNSNDNNPLMKKIQKLKIITSFGKGMSRQQKPMYESQQWRTKRGSVSSFAFEKSTAPTASNHWMTNKSATQFPVDHLSLMRRHSQHSLPKNFIQRNIEACNYKMTSMPDNEEVYVNKETGQIGNNYKDIEKERFNLDQVREFWKNEYETQVKDKLQRYVRSRKFELENQWDEDFVQKERQVNREALDERFKEDEKIKDIKKAFQELKDMNIQQTSGAIRTGVLLQRVRNKYDELSSDVFDNYKKELMKEVAQPETFQNYETRAMRWLGIQPEQLPVYFIQLMEEQQQKKNHLDMKLRRLSQKHEEECTEHSPDAKEGQNQGDDISSYRDATPVGSTPRDGDFSGTFNKQATLKSMSLTKRQTAYKRSKTPVFVSQQRKLQEFMSKNLLKQTDHFVSQMSARKQKIEDEMRIENEKKQNFKQPHNCPDIAELIDDNLSHLMNSSEAYFRIKNETQEKTHRKQVRQMAAEMTVKLEARVEEQRKATLAKINKYQQAQHKQLFLGNKVEHLVLKFIGILKKRVHEKRQNARNKSTIQFIEKLLNQKNFIDHFQSAKKHEQVQISDEELSSSRKKSHRAKKKKKLDRGQTTKLIVTKKPSTAGINLTKIVQSEVQTPIRIARQTTKEMNQLFSPETQKTTESEENELRPKPIASSGIMNQVINQYITISLQMNQQPLPVLQRITADGTFPLINFQLNESSIKALTVILPKLIPKDVKKIYMANNAINEEDLAKLLVSIFKSEGILSLGVMQNSIGSEFLKTLAEKIIPQDSFNKIKRFILKDPQPLKYRPTEMHKMINELSKKAVSLKDLIKLTLSNIGLDGIVLKPFGEAVEQMSYLHHLDISSNFLDASCLREFIIKISPNSQLRTLNISYNSAKYGPRQKKTELSPDSFEYALSKFVHKSMNLVHLDISSMSLSCNQILFIASNGIRKSRTLLAVHMSGMGLINSQIIQLREALNIQTILRNHGPIDQHVLTRYCAAKLHNLEMANVLGKTNFDPSRALLSYVDKQGINFKEKAKELIKNPIFVQDEQERIVFQRILGRNEIVNSHQWTEQNDQKCLVCQKMTYCLVLWNKHVSESEIHGFFFNHSDREPIMISSQHYSHPILGTKEQVHKMVPIIEFLERLHLEQTRPLNERMCDNIIEKRKYESIQARINAKIKNSQVEATYWSEQKEGLKKYNQTELKDRHVSDINPIQHTVAHILELLEGHVHQPFDLLKYAKLVDQEYGNNISTIEQDTYMCAFYMPDSVEDQNNLLGFVVKHPQIKGVDFMTNLTVARKKHLSPNTVPIHRKHIKKMVEIRKFDKATSVFAKWIPDTAAIMKKCFDTDHEFMKLNKFIKDPDDYTNTIKYLKDVYVDLKNQFNNQIANPKSYPVIDWMDFIDACKHWKVIDKNLTETDIDRIFIATNYEEVDLEENDDSSLCRYEFAEIIVRMAKTKYLEKGLCTTVCQSVQSIMKDHILPNTVEQMEWQPFRNELWTLEIDDMIKANQNGIETFYRAFSTYGKSKLKAFSKDDVENLIGQVYYQFPEIFQESYQEHLKKIMTSYSLSKMTIPDEMKEFERYNKMAIVEFYEFLARWATLIYPSSLHLLLKYEKILRLLLPLVGMKFQSVKDRTDIQSDSDYDDDIVEEIVQRALAS